MHRALLILLALAVFGPVAVSQKPGQPKPKEVFIGRLYRSVETFDITLTIPDATTPIFYRSGTDQFVLATGRDQNGYLPILMGGSEKRGWVSSERFERWPYDVFESQGRRIWRLSSTNAPTVTTSALNRYFQDNPVAAKDRSSGDLIRLKGTITRIADLASNESAIGLASGIKGGVVVTVPASLRSFVIQLHKGDTFDSFVNIGRAIGEGVICTLRYPSSTYMDGVVGHTTDDSEFRGFNQQMAADRDLKAAALKARQKNINDFEANKSRALLDGVVPDDSDHEHARIFAVSPKSRLEPGAVIVAICAHEPEEWFTVKSWAEIREKLSSPRFTPVRVRLLMPSGTIYEITL